MPLSLGCVPPTSDEKNHIVTWVKWTVAAIGGLALIFSVLITVGAWRWDIATQSLLQRLDADRLQTTRPRFDAAQELVSLPVPVQRFFRTVLTDGMPVVASLRLEHRGMFNVAREGADRWVTFTSKQHVTTWRPGFVWNARMAVAPGMAVRVHDAYIAGEGRLHASVLGLISLTDQRSSNPAPGGLPHGEFMRYVAEAPWYPTAMLPREGARWTAVDDHSAMLAMTDNAIDVSLLVGFDPVTGLIHSVRAEARGRSVGKNVLMTPWEGRWFDYAVRDGMKVPMRGEVAWLTSEGTRAYWRGTVTAIAYEFAP